MNKPDRLKPAPSDIPVEAAFYLDRAAKELSEMAKHHGLELKPYERHKPENSAWFHSLYGESNDRDICIMVITDEDMAPTFTALLKGYVYLHSKAGGEVVFPREDYGDWLHVETRRVDGMAGLVNGTSDLTESLRLACVYRMPHPTDPDPKT